MNSKQLNTVPCVLLIHIQFIPMLHLPFYPHPLPLSNFGEGRINWSLDLCLSPHHGGEGQG